MTLEEICSRVEAFIAAPDPSQFDALAAEVFCFQYEQNAPYRAFCQSRQITPTSLTSVDHIPAIITSAFKSLDLSVLPTADRSTAFHSSGTTAQTRSRHYHSARTLRVYEQSLLAWFKPNLLPDHASANFLLLTPRFSETPHSSLVHMFETLAGRFSAQSAEFCGSAASNGSWSLDFERIIQIAQKFLSQSMPAVICGTAFSFVHLCDFLSERRQSLTFPQGSRIFETGGYKGRSRLVEKTELHRMLSRHLGIPETHIISEYGMSELSSQAYDRKPGESGPRIYHFPPWTRASVISPESSEPVADGETGLLRILDLANVGSVIAIQTEDLARRRGEGFELLGRATEAEARGCSLMLANS